MGRLCSNRCWICSRFIVAFSRLTWHRSLEQRLMRSGPEHRRLQHPSLHRPVVQKMQPDVCTSNTAVCRCHPPKNTATNGCHEALGNAVTHFSKHSVTRYVKVIERFLNEKVMGITLQYVAYLCQTGHWSSRVRFLFFSSSSCFWSSWLDPDVGWTYCENKPANTTLQSSATAPTIKWSLLISINIYNLS